MRRIQKNNALDTHPKLPLVHHVEKKQINVASLSTPRTPPQKQTTPVMKRIRRHWTEGRYTDEAPTTRLWERILDGYPRLGEKHTPQQFAKFVQQCVLRDFEEQLGRRATIEEKTKYWAIAKPLFWSADLEQKVIDKLYPF
jgi:hypothetical protein